MLGPIFRLNARRIPSRQLARGLATNLLSQPLERLSLAELKTEAKRRGLSASGNKATLITRIQHVGKREDSPTSINSHDHNRGLATEAGAPTPPRPPRPTLDVKLPDLSIPQELPGPHIPFLPDFWDSSRKRTKDAIQHNSDTEAPMRKVLVVAGAATHHAGGPSFSPSHHSESGEEHGVRQSQTVTAGKTGFWGGVVEDLGIPQSFNASATLRKAREAVTSAAQSTSQADERTSFQSRPLNADEARGVWLLLGLLGGSWLVGGLFSSKKKDQ